MNDTLSTVAGNVLALLSERPGVIDPDHRADALSNYAWALAEAETGLSRDAARFAIYGRNVPSERVQAARRTRAIHLAHVTRLRQMRDEAIRAELARHLTELAA